ncbi:MAG: hypothetical protein QNJ51_24930 [Calothrix sp. MO_167.B12]|nr:hypothetical protein [Calothrix sp. MO_167.B12]
MNPLNNAPLTVQSNPQTAPSHEGDFYEQEPSIHQSQKLANIEGINRWSVYIFWFSLGVTVAHVSRLFGTWILFLVFILSVSGYLMFITPEGDESNIYLRRACGLAVFLSSVAYWDALIQIAVLPITIITLILPLWLVGLIIIFALLLISLGIALTAN